MSIFDDPWVDPADKEAFSLTFVPPPEVAAVAAEGLLLRARFGRGGTEVGLSRAEGLSRRQPLHTTEMRIIAAWFARHSKVRRAAGWADPQKPSTGWIAWQLWGGDAGRLWVETERDRWHPLVKGQNSKSR